MRGLPSDLCEGGEEGGGEVELMSRSCQGLILNMPVYVVSGKVLPCLERYSFPTSGMTR